MAWISLFLLFTSLHAADLPRFLTKHAPETLRYISMDGRYAYVQKKPGVLSLISSFRSVDFLTETGQSSFSVKGSRSKQRLVIEAIPNTHDEFNLIKNNRIFVVDYGNSASREVGIGRNPKLHLKDEWVSYYNGYTRTLHIQNLVTQKKFDIKLSPKPNPFFVPEVEMVSSTTLVYTDINEAGLSAVVTYNLATQTSSINYRSPQTATRLELCSHDTYLAIGEFPYDGVSRGSKVLHIKTANGVNLAGYTTIYSSIEQDVGNMVCLPESIYFVKTLNQNKEFNLKVTEAVKLDLRSNEIQAKSNLKFVSQLIEMDGRVLIPLRGELYVLEGQNNLGEDVLRSAPSKEELQLDI